MAFTIAVSSATALLFGIVPALRSTRVPPNEAIKEQGRSIAGESRFGFGSALVVAQVALSLLLVVGAGLFVRTFSSLAHVRLGFDADPILMVTFAPKRSTVDRRRSDPRSTSGSGRRRGSGTRRAQRRVAEHRRR